MTRINVVPVEELMDQHLMAEWRELPMVHAALRRSLRTRKLDDILRGIPKEYTLGKGHVSFFYDKLGFLRQRHIQIYHELIRRGNAIDANRLILVDRSSVDNALFWNGYSPTEEAMRLNRERIALRISQRPNWYRKTP